MKAITWSSVELGMPFREFSNACFGTFLMSSYLAAFFRWQVRSMTNALGVETWKAMPMFPIHLRDDLTHNSAALVVAGIMIQAFLWPSHHSFPEGPSVIFWMVVIARAMVMSLSLMPKMS